MLLKWFYDPTLAQASYLVGDPAAGIALVIDPVRDVQPYFDAAQAEGVRITHAAETHIHADFVGGLREMAARGVQVAVSAMGGDDWQYHDADALHATRLHDGDTLDIGAVRLDVMHTPGHTPEHLVFLFTDREHSSQPMGIFTGDCVFVGDVGRPDLLETAAGVSGSKEQGARQMFASLNRLRPLPDHLLILPGHGAGSACGKALSASANAVPASTWGYEKLTNPALQFGDEGEFVAWLLEGQPETPRYFGQMKRVNRDEVALLSGLPSVQPLEAFIAEDVAGKARAGEVVLIDTRPADDYNAGHLPGAMNIPAGEKFATYAGWFVQYDRPIYLIASKATTDMLVHQLRSIGVDNIGGVFNPDTLARLNTETMAQRSPAEAAATNALPLDVRAESEYGEGHLPGARRILYGHLPDALGQLQATQAPGQTSEQPLLVYCASGVRSQIGASYLRSRGMANVEALHGGIEAWQAAGMPVE